MPRSTRGGSGGRRRTIDYSDVVRLRDNLSQVPKELRRELRPKLRAAGAAVVREAQAQASWSSRIPGAIKLRTSFSSGARGGVAIEVDSSAAPHARPLEGIGSRGRSTTFRHPVFGMDVWVEQPTRPFLQPAVRATEPQVMQEIQSAIDGVLNRV